MKQRGIGEHAIEMRRRQIERKEILLPHLATRVRARHGAELGGSVEADDVVPKCLECDQVPPRPAAEVEQRERRLARDVPQQRLAVLAHVVIARAVPEGLRVAVVMAEGAAAGGGVLRHGGAGVAAGGECTLPARTGAPSARR
jgi:non-ribosomal peptide synthetase component F